MDSPTLAGSRPTSVRWVILALLLAICFVAYMQRLNFNVAGKFMMEELGFSKAQLGWMISAFIGLYTLFQVPGGILGERFGARRVMTWILTAWGICTALTAVLPGLVPGVAGSIVVLLLVRSLMGAFQGPVFPVMTGSIANWFPISGWAFPTGLTSTGLTLGAMATQPLVAWVAVSYGWRASLYLTAPFAFLTAALWWWYARDRPAEHRSVNRAELALIQANRSEGEEEDAGGVWLQVLANREVLLLTAGYFCLMYAFYFFFSWFFIYLVEDRGFSALEGGFAASVPWLVGAGAAALGGATCDWACKRWGPRWGCRGPCIVALVLLTACLLIGAVAENAHVALAFLSLAFGFNQFCEAPYWTATIFVARGHAPTASGMMNTAGNVVGVVSTQMFVLLEDQFGAIVAVASGAVFSLVAAVLWMFTRADRPLHIEVAREAP
jgi:ACS family glucarate transporter-like MFS transporter